jgi:CTP synthase (UTP-ammonia lyase)
MAAKLRIALVGDYNANVIAHQAIPPALRLAGEALGRLVEGVWMHTSSLTDPARQLEEFDGIWCIPACPYANMEGALGAIQFARESGRPFLGTCGGFQHALLEYARNVCGLVDAEHAEVNPSAALPLISPLSCPLVEKTGEMFLDEGSLIRKAYGETPILEGFHCSYGLNRDYSPRVLGKELRATAHDSEGEIRAVELTGHPFFVGTLFQPERRALRGEVPPLVLAFVAAVSGSRMGSPEQKIAAANPHSA